MYDPELKYTPKGSAVCSFVLASNRYFKQDGETQKELAFFDFTTWSYLAEVCGESLSKGRGGRVVGRLKRDRWTCPEGHGRSKRSIEVEHGESKLSRAQPPEHTQRSTVAQICRLSATLRAS